MDNKANVRINELDALRGIAALSVVLFHYTAKYREFFGYNFSEQFDFKYGHYGVSLFFIISGFVIFITINKVKSASEFITKRFIRLYPIFWVCVILTFIGVNAMDLLPKLETSWKDALLNLTMFYRVLRVFTEIKDVDGAYWSLLPELQFYLLMLLVFVSKQLKNIKIISLIWLCLIVVESFFYHIRFLGLLIDLQFGGFFIAGILFYKIGIEKEKSIWNHLFILTTLFVNILFYYKINQTGCFIMLPLVYFIFYLFIYGKLRWLAVRPLLFLGTISYPLYLIHQNLGYTLIKQIEIWGYSGYPVIFFVTILAIITAAILTFYIEKPFVQFLKMKMNFAKFNK